MKLFIYIAIILLIFNGCSQRKSQEISETSLKQSLRDIEVAKLTRKISHKKNIKHKKHLAQKNQRIKKYHKKSRLLHHTSKQKVVIHPKARKKEITTKVIQTKIIDTSIDKSNIGKIVIDQEFITSTIKSQFTPTNILMTIVQTFVKQDILFSVLITVCMHIKDFIPPKPIKSKKQDHNTNIAKIKNKSDSINLIKTPI